MKKTILSLSLALGAAFAMNAQTHEDISGNTSDGSGTGWVFEFDGTSANNCVANMDYNANVDVDWAFSNSVATLSHDGTVNHWSPWTNAKFMEGDCGWTGSATVWATQNLGTSVEVRVKAKISDNSHALALALNDTEGGVLAITAQKDLNFAANDTYEILTVTFSASDLSGLTDYSGVEGLSFAFVKDGGISGAVSADIEWIEIGGTVGDHVEASVEAAALTGVSIAPNPASSVANISYDGDAAAVTVSDITGNAVASATGANGAASVDVSGLASGVYVVTISTGDAVATQRLVVE